MPDGESLIACRALGKRFGTRVALDDLDLRVEAGEVVALLGMPEAGKTTALMLTRGLLRPSSGSVQLLGREAWRQDRWMNPAVGHLPSTQSFDGWFTGREILGRDARRRRLGSASSQQMQGDLAELLGLDLDVPAVQLSRADRQKLAVDLAFWHQPRVLLLDEPASGLDPLAQEVVHELIRQAADNGAAVMFSSLSLADAASVARRIVVLSQGQCVVDQSVGDLVAQVPHRLRVEFDDQQAEACLWQVPGIEFVGRDGPVLEARFPRSSLHDVLGALARESLSDLTIEGEQLDGWLRSLVGQGQAASVLTHSPALTSEPAPTRGSRRVLGSASYESPRPGG